MDNSFAYQPATERYERMLYKYCGRSGLKLPLISLGLWHNFGSVDDFTMATDMIKYALRLRGFSSDIRGIALHRACRWG